MSTKAEEMGGRMRSIAVSEFFEKNRHLLGFDNPQKSLITVVKEGVDNALDACEEAKILPDVLVQIDQLSESRFKVILQDNGPGIMKKHIPRVFGKLLYGSKFHRLRQSRGQQGIGISASVLYSQLTTGKPTTIYSSTSKRDKLHMYQLHIDTTKNEPEIVKEELLDNGFEHGTRIEMEVEGKYLQSHHSPYEYLRQVAIINPSSQITYIEPGGNKILYERAVERLPKMPKQIKPHPHGVELGILIRMLKNTNARTIGSFLSTEFCRMGAKTISDVCKVAEVDKHLQPKRISRDEADRLMQSLQKTKIMAPPTDCLSPIGKDALIKGLKKEINAEFITAVTRPPAVYRGYPFQIEAGIAWGGEVESEGQAKIMRYANKVPLLYQKSACASTKAVAETNWKRYGLNQTGGRGIPTGPIVIAVHMASVWVPFTSESKEAVANYPEIIDEMKLALQECGRQLGTHIRAKYRAREALMKKNTVLRYAPEIASALHELTKKSESKINQDLANLIEDKFGKIDLEELSRKLNDDDEDELEPQGAPEGAEELPEGSTEDSAEAPAEESKSADESAGGEVTKENASEE